MTIDAAGPRPDPRADPECLFCRIIAGDIPAGIVSETPRTIAIRDISPQAPTHVLVIPRDHYPDLAAAAAADPELVEAVMLEAVAVARAEGLDSGGYRMVANTGREAGQSVFHLHVHVLGGRRFEWPPG